MDLTGYSVIKKLFRRVLGKDLKKKIETAYKSGTLFDQLENIITDRKIVDSLYGNSLIYALKLNRYDESLKRKVYEKVSTGLRVHEIPKAVIKTSGRFDLPLNESASFSTSITMRSRRTQLGNYGLEWELDHKVNCYKFIDELEVRRPWFLKEFFEYKDLPKKTGIVIKPVYEAGARGVFLVFNENKILNLRERRFIADWHELLASIKDDLNNGVIRNDKWIVQELIIGEESDCEVPRDLKFYCFYGKVLLVLETARYPDLRYCFWDRDRINMITGKYRKRLFVGEGFNLDQLKVAEKISSEIPVPFIRIDFIKGKDELVFGEFTPRPGKYYAFNKELDQLLGDAFLEAEGRLINDLLEGKKFTSFTKYLEQV